MTLTHTNESLDGKFTLTRNAAAFRWEKAQAENLIHILWNHSQEEVLLTLDGYPVVLPSESILTVTFHHQILIEQNAESLIIFSFNREYYCVYDHDAEVSCNGVIFFGAQEQQVILLDETFQRKLELLLAVFVDEFGEKDNIQGEMLVILLKRLIIICTRLAKTQSGLALGKQEDVEIIRQFNLLVDLHYKEIKTVKEYADLLYKSPKTLANLFSKSGSKTPLQLIHERIVLEARRLLSYTDKNISEIAYELGFEEQATFFKLFKKRVQKSPQNFRRDLKKT